MYSESKRLLIKSNAIRVELPFEIKTVAKTYGADHASYNVFQLHNWHIVQIST